MATFTSRLGVRMPDPIDLVSVTTDVNAGAQAYDAAVGYEIVTAFPVAPYRGKAVTFSSDSYRTYFSNGTAPASGSWVEILNSSGTFGSNVKLSSGSQIVWAGDTNIYRSAASTLKTDDAFIVGIGMTVTSGITLVDQADPATPSSGTFIEYSKNGSPHWKSSNGDVYDDNGCYRDNLLWSGVYASMPRWAAGGSSTLVSGVLNLVPIWLPKGFVVGNLVWGTTGTAGATMTHQWMGLYSSSLVQLAVTSDKTSTAIAANTKFTWAIATIASGASATFTTTYAGIHFVGLMVTATTMPSAASAFGGINPFMADVPAFGPSDTAQTTPPAFAHTAATPTNVSGNAKYFALAATA